MDHDDEQIAMEQPNGAVDTGFRLRNNISMSLVAAFGIALCLLLIVIVLIADQRPPAGL
jgi:hypothetical protein